MRQDGSAEFISASLATGECRFPPVVGVMCVTLFEKLSLLIAAATLVVNIIFLITK